MIRKQQVRRLDAARAKGGPRTVEMVFVLGCSATMLGEIEAIGATISSLADALGQDGVRSRFGLIEVGHHLGGEEPIIHSFGGEHWTDDPTALQRAVAALHARGPDIGPEGSLNALMLACEPPFSTIASRVIVLVTDGRPPMSEPERAALGEVWMALRHAPISQIHLAIRTRVPGWRNYIALLDDTAGRVFEIARHDDPRKRAEDFRSTMLTIGRTFSTQTPREAPRGSTEFAFEYDVALCHVEEDRAQVEALASILRPNGVRLFHAEYEPTNLHAEQLYRDLVDLYRDRARKSIVFMSDAYTRKLSANRELEHAHIRAFQENAEHILALRLDHTEFPGLANALEVVGEGREYVCEHIDLRVTTMNTVALSGLGEYPV